MHCYADAASQSRPGTSVRRAAVLAVGACILAGPMGATPLARGTMRKPARSVHRTSSVRIPALLSSVYNVLMPPIPHERKLDLVHPTSAFLYPSSGGFRTACNNPYAVTYWYYSISPYGQSFKSCGPAPWPGAKTHHDQFQKSLDRIGDSVLRSVRNQSSPVTTGVSGTLSRFEAKYACLHHSAGTSSPDEIRSVTLIRHGTGAAEATIVFGRC